MPAYSHAAREGTARSPPPVADGLGDVRAEDIVSAGAVGDRSRLIFRGKQSSISSDGSQTDTEMILITWPTVAIIAVVVSEEISELSGKPQGK